MELDGDGVADGNLGGVTEEVAGGFLELQREALPAFTFGTQQALGAEAEVGGPLFETQTERGHLHAKIERGDTQVRGVEALARLFETGAETECEAGSHFIGALSLLVEKIERAAESRAGGKLVDAAAENQDAIAHLFRESAAQFGDVLVKFAPRLDDDLGGSGRSGSADVGDEISDGEIGFVADAGDDRNFRCEDGASDDLFVERRRLRPGRAQGRASDGHWESGA